MTKSDGPEPRYDTTEAKRLLVNFARENIPPAKPPGEAIGALLSELAAVLKVAGIAVEQSPDYRLEVAFADHRSVAVFSSQGTLRVGPLDNTKDSIGANLVWNAVAARFEGETVEKNPPPGLTGYRAPMRSAVAVLTEMVLEQLRSGARNAGPDDEGIRFSNFERQDEQ
jgi:hypothetical protein